MPKLIKTTVKTVDDVIDALGGTHAAAQLFSVTEAAVSNWRVRGLPPRRFLTIQKVLASRGIAAPPSLWRMFEAAD
jgi:DNA-binding transcriptional regulator YdaS (Cro superfamily)